MERKKEQAKERSKDYEIIIDGFKIVSRTNDATEFDDYEPELNENTKNISVLIFDGAKTNRNTKYSFALGDDLPKKEKPKALGEIDLIIQEKLDAKDKEYELKTNIKKRERAQHFIDDKNTRFTHFQSFDYNSSTR